MDPPPYARSSRKREAERERERERNNQQREKPAAFTKGLCHVNMQTSLLALSRKLVSMGTATLEECLPVTTVLF